MIVAPPATGVGLRVGQLPLVLSPTLLLLITSSERGALTGTKHISSMVLLFSRPVMSAFTMPCMFQEAIDRCKLYYKTVRSSMNIGKSSYTESGRGSLDHVVSSQYLIRRYRRSTQGGPADRTSLFPPSPS